MNAGIRVRTGEKERKLTNSIVVRWMGGKLIYVHMYRGVEPIIEGKKENKCMYV